MVTSNASHIDALESEVHVWLARPDDMTDTRHLADCIAMLCGAERERYLRFRFEQDRHLFLVAHVLLRRVLSCYIDVDPADWRFVSGIHGRPEILSPVSPVKLRFNLSHTGGLAACVVTLENACGIDVERIDKRPRMRAIAARLFADPEQRDLHALEGTEGYQDRFFTYWTLREAWYKALGTGLAHADRSIWFELDRHETVRMRGAAGAGGVDGFWHCAVLKPTAVHRLAIAVRSTDGFDKPVVCRFVDA